MKIVLLMNSTLSKIQVLKCATIRDDIPSHPIRDLDEDYSALYITTQLPQRVATLMADKMEININDSRLLFKAHNNAGYN